ncbi:hypothetical protein EV215_0573 [Hypnocyclicus thermotrophus]|uniref:Septum site-determining protein MinC n=1 Tax=Hypnocyclicus thermotrophus TaxID=1627895 RepID=A0AA46E068_9FUSO|nr:UDP-2,3-diacylglucosamine diphosphatase LpxI [Hypnocyclicus thermotrophus]TDT71881.1 hypothetical protein EV215_0573 [Hypnocyclicus thermotrophus]
MQKIGLIAGKGELPNYFIKQAEKKGIEVFPIGFFDEINDEIKKHKNFIKVNIGELGKIISYLIINKISKLMMIGKVEKNTIFQNIKFDETFSDLLSNLPDQKDETLLMGIIGILQKSGIDILPQNYMLDDLITEEKVYTNIDVDLSDIETVKVGIEGAKALTSIDVGQTVVVKDKSVVTLEGIEGTDETIKRAYKYAGEGCIIVKLARPNQDLRADTPVIGLDTVKQAVEIKAKGIVIEANKMLFFEQEESIALANKNKLFIKAIKR